MRKTTASPLSATQTRCLTTVQLVVVVVVCLLFVVVIVTVPTHEKRKPIVPNYFLAAGEDRFVCR